MYGPCLCGALDCTACRGPGAGRFSEEDAQRSWLSWSGYYLDEEGCIWSKRISSTRHVCRRDHKDGRVKKGDVYRVIKTRHIDDESGDGWIVSYKRIIQRAAA